MSFYLGPVGFETEIPNPTSFEISPFRITREERVASGLLVKDEITRKRIFRLDYDLLLPSELSILKDHYAHEGFLTFRFPIDDGEDSTTVEFRQFDYTMLSESPLYYGSARVELEER